MVEQSEKAGGYFLEQTTNLTPRVWVVNNLTTIGGKDIIASEADLGNEIYNQSINSGSLNVPARPNNNANVSGYEVTLLRLWWWRRWILRWWWQWWNCKCYSNS